MAERKDNHAEIIELNTVHAMSSLLLLDHKDVFISENLQMIWIFLIN